MKKLIFLLFAVALLLGACAPPSSDPRPTLHIAIPMHENMQNIEDNYYKCWLEQKTNCKIEISFITEDYTYEYLRLILSSENSDIDLVFFPTQADDSLRKSIEEYGENDLILPLDDFIERVGENTKKMFDTFDGYSLDKTIRASDGQVYYMPSLQMSKINSNAQVLWLNADWLKTLDIPIPKTTQELSVVLAAFKSGDPNKNGIADELPLIGTKDDATKQVINFLINSFVYNDPANARMAVKDGQVFFAPATDDWRKAMIYLNQLYEAELLPYQNFSYSSWQVTQLVADPTDLAGGFAAHSITDVITSGSDERIANFVPVSPLDGPNGRGFATIYTPTPFVGGIIPATSEYPEEAFLLMDTMLSEEASLIGQYGEQGVDWDFGMLGDLDILGGHANIHIMNTLSEKQNKILLGMGPSYLPAECIDSVTWSGFQADQKYTNARAASAYFPYTPKEHIKILHFGSDAALNEQQDKIEAFTEKSMVAFITGEHSPTDDAVWDAYLLQLEELSIKSFTEEVQKNYDTISNH